jgi:hypothetical protein
MYTEFLLEDLKGKAHSGDRSVHGRMILKCKGKAVPLRSIEAHLGDSRYSSYSFLTSALEVVSLGPALNPGEDPPVPTVQEAGWAPEPVWTQRLEEKFCAFVGDQTPAVRFVVRHCTD